MGKEGLEGLRMAMLHNLFKSTPLNSGMLTTIIDSFFSNHRSTVLPMVASALLLMPLYGRAQNPRDSPTLCVYKQIPEVSVQAEKCNSYVVLFCAGSYKEGSYDPGAWDEGTKNLFLITLANIYTSLKQNGYQKDRISIFYHDGSIDAAEKRDHKKILGLHLEKKIEEATKSNFTSKMQALARTLKKSDSLVVCLMGDGARLFSDSDPELMFEVSSKSMETYKDKGYGPPRESLSGSELKDLLSEISCRKLVVVDSCHSGYFGKTIIDSKDSKTTVVASCSEAGQTVWSRVDQFARFFFCVQQGADKNNDSVITADEALEEGERRRSPYVQRHHRDGDIGDINGSGGRVYGDGSFVLYRLKK